MLPQICLLATLSVVVIALHLYKPHYFHFKVITVYNGIFSFEMSLVVNLLNKWVELQKMLSKLFLTNVGILHLDVKSTNCKVLCKAIVEVFAWCVYFTSICYSYAIFSILRRLESIINLLILPIWISMHVIVLNLNIYIQVNVTSAISKNRWKNRGARIC